MTTQGKFGKNLKSFVAFLKALCKNFGKFVENSQEIFYKICKFLKYFEGNFGKILNKFRS